MEKLQLLPYRPPPKEGAQTLLSQREEGEGKKRNTLSHGLVFLRLLVSMKCLVLQWHVVNENQNVRGEGCQWAQNCLQLRS